MIQSLAKEGRSKVGPKLLYFALSPSHRVIVVLYDI